MVNTEGDVLLRSILEDPHDDGLRLIYADWLEDHGKADQAAFIRTQVADGSEAWKGEFLLTRGLPSLWRTSVNGFMQRFTSVFQRFPIQKVVLNGAKPWQRDVHLVVWGEAVHSELWQSHLHQGLVPKKLFRYLANGVDRELGWATYDSIDAALLDLSNACVGFGRVRAKLPLIKLPEVKA